jgi:5'-nucleotidase
MDIMRTLYVDMDNVIVDFKSGIERLPDEIRQQVEAQDDPAFDDVPGIFSLMDPMPGAIESFARLAAVFDTYILSTAPWNNPSAWSDKLLWVKRHLGDGPSSPAYKRLILSHHKNLNAGDFIIDDRTTKGVDRFGGTHIHFGTPAFPDWETVCEHLLAVR